MKKIITKITLDIPLSKQTITVYGNDYVDAGTVYAADVKPYYLWSYNAPVGNSIDAAIIDVKSFFIVVLMENLYKHHNNELLVDHLVYVLAWFLQALLL